MRFAVLADIHGNSAALNAVLSDMDTLGIADAINLGDHFSGPLDAHGTAELLTARNFPSIQGNHDRWLLGKDPSEMGASDKVAFDKLSQDHLGWIETLPPTQFFCGEVFLCHGTPTSDLTYWLERVNEDGSIRTATLDEIEEDAQGINASLILCGHTHIPRQVRLRDGRVILNPGSVGCPGYYNDQPVHHRMQAGTPNASYAVVEKTNDAWLITFRSVPYDGRKMIELAEANGRMEWSRALKTGWID
ncbi:MAG: metallophosphoesterase family protein [Pseudomonadota bacterium]